MSGTDICYAYRLLTDVNFETAEIQRIQREEEQTKVEQQKQDEKRRRRELTR
jgi:hypothetical protein